MKRSVLIILLHLIGLGIYAKDFKVYSVNGNVSKKDGSSWIALSKSVQISDNDMIKINPSSQIRLFDPSSRQIYTFTEKGEYKIHDLILKSDKENKSLAGRINSETKKQIAANSTKSHQAVGAAHRATLDEEVLEALYASLVDGFAGGKNIGDLLVEKISIDEDLFYLTFNNKSEEPIYVNIFVSNPDHPWKAIYESNEDSSILIAPNSTIATDYLLMSTSSDDKIVAVGFNQAFEAEELNDMFEEGFEPQEKKVENINICFIQ